MHPRSTQPTRWRALPTFATILVALVLGAATARAETPAGASRTTRRRGPRRTLNAPGARPLEGAERRSTVLSSSYFSERCVV